MKTTANYRILNAEGLIQYTGTEIGSWFTLEAAKKLVNYNDGETIYEYNSDRERLWEVF